MSSITKNTRLWSLKLVPRGQLPAPSPSKKTWPLGMISYRVEAMFVHVCGKSIVEMTGKDELEMALTAFIADLDKGNESYLSDEMAMKMKEDYTIKTDTDHLFANPTPEIFQNNPSFPGYARYVGDEARRRERGYAVNFLLHILSGYSFEAE